MFADVLLTFPEWLLTSGIRIAVISFILFGVYQFVKRLLDRSFGKKGEAAGRRATLRMILRTVTRVLFAIVYLMIVLPEFGFAVGPLIASLGIIGIAFTFGTQTFVRDLVAGFFLLAEDLCRVGEEVAVEKVRGRVEALRLRTLVIRDKEKGTTVFVPYGEIKFLENYSRTSS